MRSVHFQPKEHELMKNEMQIPNNYSSVFLFKHMIDSIESRDTYTTHTSNLLMKLTITIIYFLFTFPLIYVLFFFSILDYTHFLNEFQFCKKGIYILTLNCTVK